MARTQALAALTLLVLGACSTTGPPALRLGSKNFTEQVILGEIIAQHIEQRLKRPVERRLNLGGTLLAHQALTSKQLDLYPEYTGTALTAVLKQSPDNGVFEQVRDAYRRLGIEWLDPLGIDNGFAMVVRGAHARALGLKSLSDAARAATPWTLGAGYEFEQRADGLIALERTYGLRWNGRPKSMDLGLLYKALEQRQVDMIAANATDGLLASADLTVLEDDRRAFPPYELCIAVRLDTLAAVPGLRQALAELSGKFTNRAMQQLNHQVDVLHRPLPEVARGFLASAGLR